MPNFNKVILAGHLTRDVEVRNTQSGVAVGKFGLAINRKFKEQESVCYVDCVAFGKTAEILAQYTSKGKAVLVDGRLEFSQWDDKNGGGKRSKLEVVVENFQFLGGKEGGGGRQTRQAEEPAATSPDEYGDIPF